MFFYENQAERKGFSIIIGIDEAGRGPLAGPVVAAAVCLKKKRFKNRINDSKKLNPQLREQAFHEIHENSYVGVGIINEQVVDAVNILEATFIAMTIAVEQLVYRINNSQPQKQFQSSQVCLLIDGNRFKSDLPFNHETIIDGDALSFSIACASIIAKVTRDRILNMYDQILPQYGFKQHKGYSTEDHRKAIQIHGPSFIHRRSFQWSGVDHELED